jgi:tetratricopeptide (TPR) repeat protein
VHTVIRLRLAPRLLSNALQGVYVCPGANKMTARPVVLTREEETSKMRPFIRLAASVIVSAFLTGCSDPEQAKKEHFDNAERFMAAGKVQEAIVEYRNALGADARFGEARLKLADAYVAAGNGNQALREYVRAADLLPQNTEAQIRAAALLNLAGSFEDAKSRIQTVIDRDPANPRAQLVLGNALMGLKDLDGAIREIEEAIKLDPGRAGAYASLAQARLEQGDRAQAKAALEKSVQVDPKATRARLALAYFYWATNETVAAEQAYKDAVAVDPKDNLANRAIVAFYTGTNRPQMAEPYLKALADTGAPAAVLQLADFYVSLRRTSEANALLTPLAKDPANAGEAEVRLAAIAYNANDKTKAHALIDSVLRREPNNSGALVRKAYWLNLEGKRREALDVAQTAVKAEPNSAETHFALGLVQADLRMRKEAIVQFGEVLRLNPRASGAQVYLSRLNLLEGSPDNAVSFAEGALTNSPRNPQARLSLVRGLIARQDVTRAEQELAPLLKEYPRAGTIHAVDGAVKRAKKDYAASRAAYNRALELSPKSTEVLAGLIGLDLIEKKSADARARIERRVGEEPNNVDLLILAGRVYMSLRDLPQAESSLRKAIQIDAAASNAYPMLATVLLASGKIEAARAEFDQMSRRDPKNIGSATMAAMILHSQNKKDEAKKRYEAIVGGATPAPVAANNLAWIYQENNEKLDEALRLAQGAANRLPKSPEIQDTIGMIYYKQQLAALAVSAFQRSVEEAPENASYRYHLALALSKTGDSRRAREEAAEALKLKPDYAEAQKLLAELKS